MKEGLQCAIELARAKQERCRNEGDGDSYRAMHQFVGDLETELARYPDSVVEPASAEEPQPVDGDGQPILPPSGEPGDENTPNPPQTGEPASEGGAPTGEQGAPAQTGEPAIQPAASTGPATSESAPVPGAKVAAKK